MKRTLVIVAALPLFLSGCGVPVSGQGANISGITYESSIPADQKNLLVGDMQFLSSMTINSPSDSSYQKMIDVAQVTGPALSTWFRNRVHFFIGQSFDWQSNYQVQRVFSSPPQTLTSETADSNPSTSGTVNASNMGGEIYLYEVPLGIVLNVKINNTTYTVDSPRVGMVRIGPGLFGQRIPSSAPDSTANRCLRLATLFHEARHTDGHGQYAAFPHIQCTWVPGLNGDYACEAFQNGPYQVGTTMLRLFLANYGSQMSATEKATLNLIVADYASRLQSGAPFQNDQPEKIP